jgi:hypothetical protein
MIALKIDPPLPCAAIGEDGVTLCGRTATVATADPSGGGEWILLPLCQKHVAALRRMYSVPSRFDNPDDERQGYIDRPLAGDGFEQP